MNPADELRTAAQTLRTLATEAASGSGSNRWRTKRHFPNQPGSTFTSLLTESGTPLMGGGGRNRVPYLHAPVADYIAAMHPGVGTALADLLLDQADGDDEGEINPWALAVARQINGSAP
ncbi:MULTISPECIES: hypothetical protein [Streptomyces]|uniref:hypothetical protein n=1 Tax=Streptomyces TaxID=1883 RepID=UPI000B244247|nr:MULTISPECIES: hypothetical protein [Streptomyces]